MNIQRFRFKVVALLLVLSGWGALFLAPRSPVIANDQTTQGTEVVENLERLQGILLDWRLYSVLARHGFTGRIQFTLERRLGRRIDNRLADLGRLAFHDSLLGLHNDNSCAGCHAAPAGFGDSQSIAIGIDNNNIVGPNRTGPRNQRRAPMLLNNAFYQSLMWNSRFFAVSGDPFDNRQGFAFPPPEGATLSFLPHLLTAQAFIPVTEKPEMAGFDPHVPDSNGGIRDAVVARLNENSEYRRLFASIFLAVSQGGPITYEMLAKAIAEFEFTLTFSNAPVDMFARGNRYAMTDSEKRGALLFFGKAGCIQCHAVSGESNEQFSDFKQHVIGVPQLFPNLGNVPFDGPDADEDFGLEQITGNSADRYAFRTSPIRNVALQPTFFHNGAFTRLEDALEFHLDAVRLARHYNPVQAGVDPDLRVGPIEPVLQRIDPLLARRVHLSNSEFRWLMDFVREGLHDPRATPQTLRRLLPDRLPSGRPMHIFE